MGGEKRWNRFWARGSWWKAVLVVALYLVVFQVGALVVGLIGRALGGSADVGSAPGLLLSYALPIALGGLALLAFAWSVGWLGTLFGPQTVRGGRWLWVAVVVVLLTNLLRWLSIDYPAAGPAYVAAWVVTTLCIGFTEELATRGLAVTILRRAGYAELTVAVVSSLLFSAMHATNVLSGQSVFATLVQLGYTFFFGVLMYLALRATGSLLGPMLLHASTDAGTFLMSAYPNAASPVLGLAGLGNVIVILAGVVLIFFVRHRVPEPGH